MLFRSGFDERGDEYNAIMARVHKFFKDNYPDVAFFTTSMMYKSLKKDPTRTDCYANDWYCPLTSVYDLELSESFARRAIKSGGTHAAARSIRMRTWRRRNIRSSKAVCWRG